MRIALVAAMFCLFAGTAFAQEAASGEHVYNVSKCSVCHSVGGVGNKKGPLDGIGPKLTAPEIRQWITAAPDMAAKAKAVRKPPMKAYPDLTKEDLDALVLYVQGLKK